MTDCSRADVRDLLPDLLHERLDPVTRAEVERHVSACADCAAEMRILRGARAALARTPAVNVEAIAERIRGSSRTEREAAGRFGSHSRRLRAPAIAWRVAAALALIASGAAGLAIWRASNEPQLGATVEVVQTPPSPSAARPESAAARPAIDAPPGAERGTRRGVQVAPVVASTRPRGEEIVFGGGVGDLADADLEALLDDLKGIDGLTDAEPQPVLPVIGEGV